jgi:Zn-dependent peptidase ImmA (M78 family)
VPLYNDEDFEAAARSLRRKLGIDDQLRPDMITVIIKLKDRGMIRNYVRVADDEMPNDEARFDPFEKLLYISESTFSAANGMFCSESARRRARYTIAHEIGHIALGHTGVRYRGDSGALGEKNVRDIRREEFEANRFAAAFLAPAHLANRGAP